MNKSHNIVLQKSKEFNAWYLIDIILNSQLSNIRGGFLWISWVRSSWWLHVLWICCSLSSQSWTPLWYQSFTCKLLIFLNSAGDFVQGRARDQTFGILWGVERELKAQPSTCVVPIIFSGNNTIHMILFCLTENQIIYLLNLSHFWIAPINI